MGGWSRWLADSGELDSHQHFDDRLEPTLVFPRRPVVTRPAKHPVDAQNEYGPMFHVLRIVAVETERQRGRCLGIRKPVEMWVHPSPACTQLVLPKFPQLSRAPGEKSLKLFLASRPSTAMAPPPRTATVSNATAGSTTVRWQGDGGEGGGGAKDGRAAAVDERCASWCPFQRCPKYSCGSNIK